MISWLPSRSVAALALASVALACPAAVDVDAGTVDDASAIADAGAATDAGPIATAHAGALVDAGAPVELAVDPRGFRFVRLRSPTVGGDEIVRVGLGERVRLVDGVPETREAPSAESLAILSGLCADREVAAALTPPGVASGANAATLELACAPLSGTIVCEGACGPAFDKVRAAVVAAWREEIAPPESGIDVRATKWTLSGAGATVAPTNANVVLHIDGKPLLPARDRPFGRVLAKQTARLCPASAADGTPAAHMECVDVIAPALVHLDVIEGASRWRCATCSAAAPIGRLRTRRR